MLRHGLKGITIYRDGSRDNQPIETKKESESKSEAPATVTRAEAEEKPSAEESSQPAGLERAAEEHEHVPYSSKVKQRSTPIVFGKTIKDARPGAVSG